MEEFTEKRSFFWTLPKLPIPLASDLDNFSTLFCPESNKNCQNEFGQGDLPPIEAMQKRKVFFQEGFPEIKAREPLKPNSISATAGARRTSIVIADWMIVPLLTMEVYALGY